MWTTLRQHQYRYTRHGSETEARVHRAVRVGRSWPETLVKGITDTLWPCQWAVVAVLSHDKEVLPIVLSSCRLG